MANPILPRDLPPAPSVPSTAAIIVDNGVNVEKATPAQIVDSARPLASQAEAETGTDNTKTMTPLRTAQAIDGRNYDGLIGGKEPIITAGTTAQYYRGDKSWQTLDKAAAGLPNVDNTSDVNKPVSTAQQTAIDAKTNAAAIGIAGTDANMGLGGTILTDNATARTWFGELETAIIETPGTAFNKSNAAAIGIDPTAENMGIYTGTTITDNETAKQNIQSLETAVETKANATALGVAASAADMGTFTGSIIPDSQTGKQALQALETAVETKVTSTTLAASGGAALVGYKRPGLAGAATRTQEVKNKDVFDLRDMDGIDLTGTNDNRAALQTAIDQAAADKAVLYIPGGIIAVDGSIQVPQGFSMQGSGRAAKGPASRFLFTSLDEGFVCGDGAGDYEEGFSFRDIVTSRDQPTPPGSGSWTSVDAAADFVMNGAAQLDLEHVLFLNSTRGVNMEGGTSIGRLTMDRCGGQVFVYGVNIELAADVCQISNVHWWPYWSDTKPVNDFSCANADHFYIKRCDSPIFSNVTSIASRSGFRFANNVHGKTTKALITNAALDYATTNIWFDSTTNGTYAWFNNVAMQANNSDGTLANINSVDPRRNIKMEGTNCSLGISGADLGGTSGSAVEVGGTSNEVTFSGLTYIHDYGGEGGTEACFDVASGSRIFISDRVRVDAPGAGPMTGGAGRFDGIRQDYVPSVTPQGGALTTTTIDTAKFIRQGRQVSGTVTLANTDAGTATGYLRVSTPWPVDHTFAASAIDVTTGDVLYAISITGNPGFIQIQRVGGGNVAVTGRMLTISFTYEVTD